MRVLLLTYGSRGDVQPFLALAVALQKSGHQVNLAAPHRFEEWVSSFGVPFVPLAGDPEIISQRLNEAGRNPFSMVNAMMTYTSSIADQVIFKVYAVCKNTDLIVHSFLFTTGAHSIARAFGIPDVSLQTFPVFVPTREISPVFLPRVKNGPLRYFFHWLAKEIFWHVGNMGYRRLSRKNKDVPKFSLHWPFAGQKDSIKSPLIFAYSPAVVPSPSDWKQFNIHVCGYLFLQNKEQKLSKDLQDFLNQGESPVCISFGSLVHKSLPQIIQIILHACVEAKLRVVLLSGWEENYSLDSSQNLFITKEAPHEKLFPKCSMIIHHGGAGTTAAALQSGIPSLVIPFGADQLFWGMKVYEIGAGPAPIPENQVTVQNIIQAIAYSQSEICRKRAEKISGYIKEENGFENVIRIIEEYKKDFHNTKSD